MGIEYILESDFESDSGLFDDMIKSEVVVHCSCGEDYRVKEKFNVSWTGDKRHIRPSFCPKCKDKSYLLHLTRHRKGDIFGYGVLIARLKEPPKP